MFGRIAFNAAEAAEHLSVQNEFGECFQFTPMRVRPNYSPAPDPSRKTYTLIGIFEWETKQVALGLDQMNVTSRAPQVTFRRCDILAPMKRGDMLTRVSTGDAFEITDTQPDSVSGVKIKLVELGVQ